MSTTRIYQCCNTCKHQTGNFYVCSIRSNCFNGFSAYKAKSPCLSINVYAGEKTVYGDMYTVDYNSPSVGMTLFTGDRAQAEAEYDRLQALANNELHAELMSR